MPHCPHLAENWSAWLIWTGCEIGFSFSPRLLRSTSRTAMKAETPEVSTPSSPASAEGQAATTEAKVPKPKPPAPKPPTLDEIKEKLDEKQLKALQKLEAKVFACDKQTASATTTGNEAFAEKASACSQLRALLGDNYRHYMLDRFKYQKSHAARWALAGEVLAVASPRGDDEFLTSEAHVRPLGGLDEDELVAVLDRLRQWKKWSPTLPLTPAWCEAAAQLQNQNPKPNTKPHANAEVVEKVLGLFKEVQESLPKQLNKTAADSINWFKQEVEIIGQQSTTGIAWTQATWNPLHGCKWKSPGCDNCYAAQLMATRMQPRYPGLAEARVVKGKKSYFFTNKILLDPKDLAEVLVDKTPKRYFVNSMSDLFHEGVREDYINAVFDVMERAWWHQYQILTKRPERMAKYSQKRYADRTPPPHIWLGTTVENQDAFDERVKHLASTKTAVPWLSCEPLLGPIDFGDKKPAAWVVVGGESDSDRKMDAAWATSLRDQCKELGVTFFFKQWGDFNEEGVYQKMRKADFGVLPKLNKAAHGDYPMSINLDVIKKAGKAKDAETRWTMLRGCLLTAKAKPAKR